MRLREHRGLLVVLVFYFFWSAVVDNVYTLTSFMQLAYPKFTADIPNIPFWKLLLPQPEMTGSYSASGLLLFHWFENLLHSTGLAYQLITLVTIAVLYAFTYDIFRSRLAAVLAAFAFSMSTHNYHIFTLSGSTMLSLVGIYALSTAWCGLRYLQTGRVIYAVAGLISLLVLAISYEGWLDFMMWTVLMSPLVALFLYRRGQREILHRGIRAVALLVVVAVCHILIKIKLGFGQDTGSESDLAFHYHAFFPIIEDMMSNTLKNMYIVVSTFLPPFLTSSNTLMKYDSTWLIAQQNGYHSQFSYLAYMNHLFLWRYYAGMVFTIVAYWIIREGRATYRELTYRHLTYFLLLLGLLFSGSTHSTTKFRPFDSAPFLGYHVWFGVFCAVILMGLLVNELVERQILEKRKRQIIGLFVFNILLVAFFRPSYLAQMQSQLQMGAYSTPIQNLRSLKDRIKNRLR